MGDSPWAYNMVNIYGVACHIQMVQTLIFYRCDGVVSLQVAQGLKLRGMKGASIEYARYSHAEVELTVLCNNQKYLASVDTDDREDALLIRLHSNWPTRSLENQLAFAHFKINHSFFRRLHQALDCAGNSVLSRLVPMSQRCFSSQQHVNVAISDNLPIPVDEEYQLQAFQGMLSCCPGPPYLLLGPFGTGKTRLLAAVVIQLLQNDARCKILIASHQHIAANSLYQILLTHSRHIKALRLVPDQKSKERFYQYSDKRPVIVTVRDVLDNSINTVQKCSVIVTTFMTALNLKVEESRVGKLPFTHILIDEGAQSREPEVLGALSLAKRDTIIIIAGDSKQVCSILGNPTLAKKVSITSTGAT